MVRVGPMASPEFPLDRREFLTGLGAAALAPAWPAAGHAQSRSALPLQAKAESVALRPDAPRHADLVAARARVALQAWRDPRHRASQRLPVPAASTGAGSMAPRPPNRSRAGLDRGWRQGRLATATAPRRDLPLRRRSAGRRPTETLRALALIVQESGAVAVDRDEVLLIEDWRIGPDGTAIAPGTAPGRRPANLYD